VDAQIIEKFLQIRLITPAAGLAANMLI